MKDYFSSFVIFRIALCAALDVLRLRKKIEELFTIFIPTLFLQSMYSKFSIWCFRLVALKILLKFFLFRV